MNCNFTCEIIWKMKFASWNTTKCNWFKIHFFCKFKWRDITILKFCCIFFRNLSKNARTNRVNYKATWKIICWSNFCISLFLIILLFHHNFCQIISNLKSTGWNNYVINARVKWNKATKKFSIPCINNRISGNGSYVTLNHWNVVIKS